MYFKVKPDSCLTWTLIEQSTDETGELLDWFVVSRKIDKGLCPAVHRPLTENEDPSEVVDFWGKSKVGASDTINCHKPHHSLCLPCRTI